MKRIIGIDLGTTNTLCATVFDEGPEVIGDSENVITPSILSRVKSKWIIVKEAQKIRTSNPFNTIFSIKRLMGRDISDLEDFINELPFKIIQADRKLLKIRIFENDNYIDFTPQELSAEILKKIKILM